MKSFRSIVALSVCLMFLLGNVSFAEDPPPTIHCPECGTAFQANGTYIGRWAGTATGAAGGAAIGSQVGTAGIVGGPTITITVPLGVAIGGVLGGVSGFIAGGYYDACTCPKCGYKFKY